MLTAQISALALDAADLGVFGDVGGAAEDFALPRGRRMDRERKRFTMRGLFCGEGGIGGAADFMLLNLAGVAGVLGK